VIASTVPALDDSGMDSENPYASPRYTAADAGPETPSIDAATMHGARRYGKYLIVRRDAELPQLCKKCGSPSNGPLRQQKLHWADSRSIGYWASLTPVFVGMLFLGLDGSWYAWILFFGLMLLSSWMGRRFVQRASVFFRLCERHEARSWTMFWLSLMFGGIAALAFIAGIAMSLRRGYNPVGSAAGLFVFATFCGGAAALCAARMSTNFNAHRIEGDFVWLTGLQPAFLSQIPEVSAAELTDWAKTAPRDA